MASRTPPSDALAAWLAQQRWFAAKTRTIATVTVEDRVRIAPAELLLVSVQLDDRSTSRYAIPLLTGGPDAAAAADDGAHDRAARAPDGAHGATRMVDGLDDPRFGMALLEMVRAGGRVDGERGVVVGVPTRAFPALPPGLHVRRLGAEQSNTSVAFGDRLILKHFRRMTAGPNPEEEVGRFLAEHTSFTNTPGLAGHLEYEPPEGATMTLAVVHEMVPNARDGWEWTLDQLRSVFERARHAGHPASTPVAAIAGPTLDAFHRLGEVTALLHRALAGAPDDPAFAAESITPADTAAWSLAIERQLRDARHLVPGGVPPLPDLADSLAGLLGRAKTRHHGDFHLGQTLYRPSDGDFLVIDFEGEPLRPIDERRRKHTPLRDVAGMLRSIDYAAATATPAGLEAWGRAWRSAAETAFIAAYRAASAGAPFVPEATEAFRRSVAVFELEKAAYEVVYEANHRPTWLRIPIDGLGRAVTALASVRRTGAA
jgi:trehalose synthase-fused probable maltokinase